MYGQYDWEGRLISFIIRLLQIIFRTFLLIIWTILSLIPIIIWVALPVVIIIQINQELERLEQVKQKKEETLKKAGTILPILIVGLILYKLFAGN